jgi:RNA polymerase sigma-70 factor (ECF subfamily)
VTDEELIALARQGDADAFDQLVGRHQTAVYRAALAALRVPEDAEEAAQDAFVRAWTNLRRFRGDSSFRTWVLTIVWNRSMTRRRSVLAWFRHKAPVEDARDAHHVEDSAHDRLQGTELKVHAAHAIEALSPKLRDTLLLAASGEYDYQEIAVMLGVPVGTVKWRVSEARRKVRTHLSMLGYLDAR